MDSVDTTDATMVADELVDKLRAVGVGDWKPAAVRQWIREEPPCPVAVRGRRGQSHRYQFEDVVAWLNDRDARAAVRNPASPVSETEAETEESIRAQAKKCATGDVELVRKMLEILEGRDPRNWKAAEEAMMTRLKRLQMQRELVPADEMALSLGGQQSAFVSAVQQLRSQLKMAARSAEKGADVVPVIDSEADKILDRLAREAERYLQMLAA